MLLNYIEGLNSKVMRRNSEKISDTPVNLSELKCSEFHGYSVTERHVSSNGLSFFVRDYGRTSDPAVLLVMGLACQLTVWPPDLIKELLGHGYRVICFDNRDVGLSSKINGQLRVNTIKAFACHRVGFPVRTNYNLYDMAKDVHGLIENLELKQVHLVGVSMGGMVAQIVAACYPQRVASLTAIMTSTNSPLLPLPDIGLIIRLSGAGSGGHDLDSVKRRVIAFWKAVQSPAYPKPIDEIEFMIERDYQRNYCPGGIIRQTQAILSTRAITSLIRRIGVPTQVIHGDADPLIKLSGGRAVADAIPDARLAILSGMGHDLPDPLLPQIADLIHRNAIQT
ncbi:alpha/beta fold hydrolase [Litoribrevibacter albus]|uniref:Lipase/esterase LipG n=1 Tax=Litoribrevibacter albus TaxID=1473156 RepID=A0AA37SDC1_9GAMM|nr:alpha/beta hydrolase [Litoribrevibacter albus]GLQ32268.1 putative lipase/esterase LipG [Litoribrevibacter albus]